MEESVRAIDTYFWSPHGMTRFDISKNLRNLRMNTLLISAIRAIPGFAPAGAKSDRH
jgi:hypothetical protein